MSAFILISFTLFNRNNVGVFFAFLHKSQLFLLKEHNNLNIIYYTKITKEQLTPHVDDRLNFE